MRLPPAACAATLRAAPAAYTCSFAGRGLPAQLAAGILGCHFTTAALLLPALCAAYVFYEFPADVMAGPSPMTIAQWNEEGSPASLETVARWAGISGSSLSALADNLGADAEDPGYGHYRSVAALTEDEEPP